MPQRRTQQYRSCKTSGCKRKRLLSSRRYQRMARTRAPYYLEPPEHTGGFCFWLFYKLNKKSDDYKKTKREHNRADVGNGKPIYKGMNDPQPKEGHG